MKINYVTIATDKLASFRYNIKTPAMELSKMGHEVTISPQPLAGKDAYIFHKHLRPEEPFLMKMAKKDNPKSKTYYIVCDYHLDNKHANHYYTMINQCDQLIVCTEAMRKVLKDATGKNGVVIKDPWGIEFEETPPNFTKKKNYNLLWFGSKTNLGGLLVNLCDIPENYHLTVVTEHESGTYDIQGRRVKIISHSPWIVKEQFKVCDAVIIPQDVSVIGKNVKTHNRLVDTIRVGKIAITSPVDAYKELDKYAWVGGIKEGFEWLSNQTPEQINNMVLSGQEYIKGVFSPLKIAERWEQVLSGST